MCETRPRNMGLVLPLLLLAMTGNLAAQDVKPPEGAGRDQVPPRWWESAASICRISLKSKGGRPTLPLKDGAKLSAMLDDMREQGIDALEIFAASYGGKSFGGLDAIERYRIDPAAGDMDDFRRLVRMAHAKGMPIITFDNLGYCSVDAPAWIKACEDVREGRESPEARWFLWSDKADAPAPPGDSVFLIGGKPTAGEWVFSDRAGRYFWSKWAGVDKNGEHVRLPQYNWGSPEWQEEADRIVRFWMDTGLDGMIVDAVNWYPNYTWELGRRRLTSVIDSYGNAYSQPEGGGGFHEDPVAWITEGGWKSVQNYGLGIWWEPDSDVAHGAVASGDPRPIERALRDYHDRVIAAGGVLYLTHESHSRFDEPEKQTLALAVSGLSGSLLSVTYHQPGGILENPEVRRLVKLKRAHPALNNISTRRQLPTATDDKHYAFLRTARDNSERILVVMNFQSASQTVNVDLSGVATTNLVDLKDDSTFPRKNPFPVELPAFGYRIYRVDSCETEK